MSNTARLEHSPVDFSPADFAREAYRFLVSLDPAIWRAEAAHATHEAAMQLQQSAKKMLASWDQVPPKGIREERLRGAVETFWEAMPDPHRMTVIDWPTVREQLAPLYESMATALRRLGEPVEHLHPTNYTRNLLHAGSAAGLVLAYEFVLTEQTAILAALAWVLWAWTLEISRRYFSGWNDFLMWIFGPFARPHEHYRVNSATWMGTAILALTLTTPGPVGVLALIALGFGDPAAQLVGRRFGRTKIRGNRSLEGAMGFAAATLVVGFAYLSFFYPAIPGYRALLMAGVAGVIGAAAEATAGRLEDNLLVPLAAAWGLAAVLLFV